MNYVVNGETVYFAGGHFELNDTTDEVTKYYFAGASRIAMRQYVVPQTTSLKYLLGDHLGSTSMVTDEVGALLVETRYKPWGEVRYTTQDMTLPTRYTFTGQYSYVDDAATDLGIAGFGLMFYNARWYDPTIGRFAQADSIVPGGLQGLDRYAYVGNSPVMYVDPTGHAPKKDPYWCVNAANPSQCRKDYYDYMQMLANATFILFCGWDDEPCGKGGALAPYDKGNVIYVDCVSGGKNLTKEQCYNKFLTDPGYLLDLDPDAYYILVGHSAGADVAILAAAKMIER